MKVSLQFRLRYFTDKGRGEKVNVPEDAYIVADGVEVCGNKVAVAETSAI
jgi:hypothetical protein